MFPVHSNPNTSPDIPSLPLTIESDLYKRRARSKESDLNRDFSDYDTLDNEEPTSKSSLYLDVADYVVKNELEQKLTIYKLNAAHDYQQKYGLVIYLSGLRIKKKKNVV